MGAVCCDSMAGSKRDRSDDPDKKSKKKKKSEKEEGARKSPRLQAKLTGETEGVVDPSKPRDFGSLGGWQQINFPSRSLVAEAIAAKEKEEAQEEDVEEPILNICEEE